MTARSTSQPTLKNEQRESQSKIMLNAEEERKQKENPKKENPRSTTEKAV